MRFKSIFWLFNIVVFIALALIVAGSIIILGEDSISLFWGNMWFLIVVFTAVVGILDAYFIRNWKLFTYLENEDWASLLAWLEEQLYIKHRLNQAYANLLINTALTVSNYESVKKLEKEIRTRKPSLIKHVGVSLGIPLFRDRNPEAIKNYYGPLAKDPKTKQRSWARWANAQASADAGIAELVELLNDRDPAIVLLSINVLENYLSVLDENSLEKLQAAKSIMIEKLKGSGGEKLISRSREDNLLASVLSSWVEQSRKRLLGLPVQ